MQEKLGGSDYDFDEIKDFRNAIGDCSLSDLGHVGEMMMRSNGQEGWNLILEYLDHVLGSME